ncbi:hypothetical protein [Saccharothrix xinjiangensis]|uniref:DUF1542 domain-containing protein n=1 Tax=Saccharothrix xinjiangensis TaxID=204798 RepID=A0ABV9XTD9_9PSEU
MCRAGGRRCPNAGGRSTQTTRQAVSRARRALRHARETGNPDRITAAQDRLDAARTAHRQAKDNAVSHHHDQGQDHAADHHPTAGHDRDVTPSTTDDDTTTTSSTQDTGTHHYGGFVLHNTNYAAGPIGGTLIQTGVVTGPVTFTADGVTAGGIGDVTPPPTDDDTNNVHGNAHVGSQHDVHHGTTRPTSRTRPTAGQDRDVTDRDRDDDTTDDQGGRRGTRNTASGNDHVTQQVGFTLAALRRLRRR